MQRSNIAELYVSSILRIVRIRSLLLFGLRGRVIVATLNWKNVEILANTKQNSELVNFSPGSLYRKTAAKLKAGIKEGFEEIQHEFPSGILQAGRHRTTFAEISLLSTGTTILEKLYSIHSSNRAFC